MYQSVRTFLYGGSAIIMGIAAATQRFSQDANRMAGDNTFVIHAAQGGMAEVEMGKLAESRSSDDKVRQFGRQMVDDHSKANEELATIAGRKGINLPANLDAKDQATMDTLAKLNGPQFDKAYMQDMVKDHRQDSAAFKKEANSGQDPDFKAFAAKTLPVIEHHLSMAERTSRDIGK